MYSCWLRPTIIVLASAALTACMVGPDFHSPVPPQAQRFTKAPLPKKTVSIPAAGQAGKSQYLAYQQELAANWWTLFHSPALNQLIQQGLANNPTLAQAKQTLIEAQENLRVQIGNLLFPAVNLQLGAARDRTSGLNFGSSTTPPSTFSVYNASVPLSYTLDIFGGSRRQVEAAAAQVDYERYQLMGAYVTLTTNIVTTTVAVASLQGQIDAVKSLVQEESQQLAIVQKQEHLGGASVENVLSQETQLAQTEALLPPLETALAQSQHALAVLVGQLPSQSTVPAFSLNSLVLPIQIPLGIPSNLVKQRPDIQASEALLHEASAQIGVATANLLPQVTLNASYGWVSTSPNTLFNPNSVIWDIASQLTQPLFHGGALLAQRREAIAAYQAAFDQYRQTVLTGFKDVSDVLYALENDAMTFKAYKAAEVAARQTFIITSRQFKLGGASYLQLLSAEQQYEQAKINSIKAQAARYSDTAALFQALGGGWWNQGVGQNPTPAKQQPSCGKLKTQTTS